MLNIVLVEPEIPQNTGNIARTCAATGSVLHLIKPLGFSLDDKYMRRAGLDYWFMTELHVYENWQEFCEKHPDARMFFASTKSRMAHSQAQYRDGDFLVFGRETRGLPEELIAQHMDTCIRIPMRAEARSLNLSNSVAVVVYEALRQLDYPGLSEKSDYDIPAWRDYV